MDCVAEGFEWLVGDDADNSVYAYLRHDGDGGHPPLLVVRNFTPVQRDGYRIGVPTAAGHWLEILNTDAAVYGGGNAGNLGKAKSEAIPAHGKSVSLSLSLPPLSTPVFKAMR